MPKFEVGPGYFAEFDTVPLATASGDVVVFNDQLIRIRTEAGDGRPAGFENYIGRFETNAQDLPVGTIDTYRFVTDADRARLRHQPGEHRRRRTQEDRGAP